MKIKLEFKLQDMWIGLFWETILLMDDVKMSGINSDNLFIVDEKNSKFSEKIDLWICLIPCFPIHITWRTKSRKDFNFGNGKRKV